MPVFEIRFHEFEYTVEIQASETISMGPEWECGIDAGIFEPTLEPAPTADCVDAEGKTVLRKGLKAWTSPFALLVAILEALINQVT